MTNNNFKTFLQNKYIVITRPELDSMSFKKKLEQCGAHVYVLPSIRIINNTADIKVKSALTNISDYDWIIFTSAKSIDFLLEVFKAAGISKSVLASKKIAAVGPKTAQKIKAYSVRVDFIPTRYTTNQLAKEIENIQGLKILLPRANIASKKFTLDLQKKGALVTDIPLYKTEYIYQHDPVFEDLVKTDKINYITFTSSSTVMGFLERVKGSSIREKVFRIPILSIGPVTTKTAQKQGFLTIFTADNYTTNGMMKKLQEIA